MLNKNSPNILVAGLTLVALVAMIEIGRAHV